jgi:hypothetical protein
MSLLKTFLTLVLISSVCLAQEAPPDPRIFAVTNHVTKPPSFHGPTNAPVPILSPYRTLAWTASVSPGVVSYSVYRATNVIKPAWTFYGSTTMDVFMVDVTSAPSAFYFVASVNSAGIHSKLP